MILRKEELSTVVGGSLSASMLNAVSRIVSTIYDIGYAIGSSIRRIFSNTVC